MPSGKLSCLITIPNISIEFLTEELEVFFFFYPSRPLSKVTKNIVQHWVSLQITIPFKTFCLFIHLHCISFTVKSPIQPFCQRRGHSVVKVTRVITENGLVILLNRAVGFLLFVLLLLLFFHCHHLQCSKSLLNSGFQLHRVRERNIFL